MAVPVPREILEGIAALAPVDPGAGQRRRGASFDIEEFSAKHLSGQLGPWHAWNGGRKAIFDVCPFNEAHTDRSAVLIQFASGAVTFRCHHNGCTGKSWSDLRAMYEPAEEQNGHSNGQKNGHATFGDLVPVPKASDLVTCTLTELMGKRFPAPNWIVPDILPEGTTLLCGKAKKGKSWFALSLSLAAAFGGTAFGSVPVPENGVLYMDLEGSEELLQSRCRDLLHGEVPPENFHTAVVSPTMDVDGAALLGQWLIQHPEIRFVVVDTLERVRMASRGRNAYREDYESLKDLVDLSHQHRVAILVLHHLTKNPCEDDPFDEINGSMGLQAAPDTLQIFRGVRGDSDAVLHIAGRRIQEDQALAFRFNKDIKLWCLVGKAEDVEKRKERQAIVDTITEYGEPMQPRDIAAVLDKNVNTVRVLLHKMVKSDEIDHPRNGLYSSRPQRVPIPITAEKKESAANSVNGVNGPAPRPVFWRPDAKTEGSDAARDHLRTSLSVNGRISQQDAKNSQSFTPFTVGEQRKDDEDAATF